MTAEAQLERLLWLIPAASGAEGSPLADLAAAMQASVDDVLRDVETLTARAFYHPPASADDLQVLIDEDRLYIWTGGELQRPARLTVREALALGIGLRAAALRHGGSRSGRMLRLARRLEEELAGADVSDLDRAHEVDLGQDESGVRPALEAAVRDRHAVRIRYLKAGAPAPEDREVLPYALVYAEGAWYLIAETAASAAAESAGAAESTPPPESVGGWRDRMRAFRFDRILESERLDRTFHVPPDFDIEEHLTGARVYRPRPNVEQRQVQVRYAPAVSRWIRERVATDAAWAASLHEEPDGSLLVTHDVADPSWIVGHVLQYGPDAEVVAPPDVRALVATAARRVAAATP